MMLLNKQKPYYCMEPHFVNTEATSIESEVSYSGRSDCNPLAVRESTKEETVSKAGEAMATWCDQKSAEVVVLRIRAAQSAEVSQRQEGLNVRMAKQSRSFMAK